VDFVSFPRLEIPKLPQGVEAKVNGRKTPLRRDGDCFLYDGKRCTIMEKVENSDLALVSFLCASAGECPTECLSKVV